MKQTAKKVSDLTVDELKSVIREVITDQTGGYGLGIEGQRFVCVLGRSKEDRRM